MKNSKTAKILMLIISAALLVGSVFCIGISAEETNTTGEIAAQSVIYGEKTYIEFAVYASSANEVNVTYTWEGDETVYTASEYTGDNYSEDTVIFVTDGVALYELGKQVTVTVKVGEDVVDTKTYSVAEFLYKKLYVEAVTGEQKAFYESLLECGANLQTYKGIDTDALVTDLTYVYTENALVTVKGAGSAMVNGSVELNYVGTDKVAAWVVDDEIITTDENPYTAEVSGNIVKIDVVETHDHYDETNDHKCDRCDATITECADENNDHKCDVCGDVITTCVDEDSNDICDICGAYCFKSGTVIEIQNYLAENKTAISSTDISSGTGVGLSIAQDPTDNTNNVLKAYSNGANKTAITSYFTLEANKSALSEGVEAGVYVFSFDYYFAAEEHKTYKAMATFYVNYSDGTSTQSSQALYKPTLSDSDDEDTDLDLYFRAGTTSDATLNVAGKQWVKIMCVLDVYNKSLTTYLSTDGGSTWTNYMKSSVSLNSTNVASMKYMFASAGNCTNRVEYLDDICFDAYENITVKTASGDVVHGTPAE